jgi:hypothetical protein
MTTITTLLAIPLHPLCTWARYHPAATPEEREKQRKTRKDSETFLTGERVAPFVRRLAERYEIPEFLGVLSLLGANDLAYKSMWRGTVDKAMETNNEFVLSDTLHRFEADERVRHFANRFYENNHERLETRLRDLRMDALFAAMRTSDLSHAHAAVLHLVRSGAVQQPGATAMLVTLPAYVDGFRSAAVEMARKFVCDAEKSAMASLQQERELATRPRSSSRGSPTMSRGSVSSVSSSSRPGSRVAPSAATPSRESTSASRPASRAGGPGRDVISPGVGSSSGSRLTVGRSAQGETHAR